MTLLFVWLVVSIVCTAFVLVCMGFAPIIEESPASGDHPFSNHSTVDEAAPIENGAVETPLPTADDPIIVPKANLGGFGDFRSQEPRA